MQTCIRTRCYHHIHPKSNLSVTSLVEQIENNRSWKVVHLGRLEQSHEPLQQQQLHERMMSHVKLITEKGTDALMRLMIRLDSISEIEDINAQVLVVPSLLFSNFNFTFCAVCFLIPFDISTYSMYETHFHCQLFN